MSITELKKTAENLNDEERTFMAAYLKHLSRLHDPAYQAFLTGLNQEIDQGRRFSLDQVQRMHQALKDEGV